MNSKPKCIIATGRPGAGKSTLAAKLGRQLWMPVISRDEIKECYVNTFGVKHDQLPPETNGVVTDFFFVLSSNIWKIKFQSSSKRRFNITFGRLTSRKSNN